MRHGLSEDRGALETDGDVGPGLAVALDVLPEDLVQANQVGFDGDADAFGGIERFGGLKEGDGIEDVVGALLEVFGGKYGVDAVDDAEEVVVGLDEGWLGVVGVTLGDKGDGGFAAVFLEF